jgi:hypothetical protein
VKGILSPGIAITHLPYILTVEQTPGNIGSGDGTQEVTQQYY